MEPRCMELSPIKHWNCSLEKGHEGDHQAYELHAGRVSEEWPNESKPEPAPDNLSAVHFKTVWAEIQGRFFSREEAGHLKAAIDRATVTDPKIRVEAAKSWET